MTANHKPVASKKTLRLNLKVIQEEIKENNVVLKLCEQEVNRVNSSANNQDKHTEVELECNCTEHPFSNDVPSGLHHLCVCPKDCKCSASSHSWDADMQMLMWELEDNTHLASAVRLEMEQRVSERKKRKEELERQLAETIEQLKYFSFISSLYRMLRSSTNSVAKHCELFKTFCDDYMSCFGGFKDFGKYVKNTLPLVIAAAVITALCALSGAFAVAMAYSVIYSLLVFVTTFDIMRDSGRNKSPTLFSVAAFFPLVFRILPVTVVSFVIASSLVPIAARNHAIDDYFKNTAAMTSHYWNANFRTIDRDDNGLVTAKELSALRDELKIKPAAQLEDFHTPEGKQLVDRVKILDTKSQSNMMEHLQLHWLKISHPIVFKQDPNASGKFIPLEYGLNTDDLTSYEKKANDGEL